MIGKMTTTRLILGAFALTVAIMVGGAYTSYYGIEALGSTIERLHETELPNALDVERLNSSMDETRGELLTLVLETDRAEQERLLKSIHTIRDRIEGIFEGLLERARGREDIIQVILTARTKRRAQTEIRDGKIVPAALAGRQEEARALLVGAHEELYGETRWALNTLRELIVRETRSEVARAQARQSSLARVFLTLTAVNVGVTILLALFLYRFIARQADELKKSIDILASSGTEILAATSQMAASATEIASSISQTTATVEEVKQTSQLSSDKARYVSDKAKTAGGAAERGKESVEATIAAMSKIRDQMNGIAHSTLRLSEQGVAIGEIIASVSDLADQSNVLAVNAAIEAAKAGEHGKGFAVVAQEIRNLAEQSKQATAGVRTILSDVQRATAGTVTVTEQGSKAVESGVDQSEEAGEALHVLADMVSEAATSAVQIAASSQQQMIGIDQVAAAMNSIREASAQNASASRQTEAAARGLNELAQRLKGLTERYRL